MIYDYFFLSRRQTIAAEKDLQYVLDKYSNYYMEENPGTNSTTFLHKCLVCYCGGSES
jgi:hypothetical protein